SAVQITPTDATCATANGTITIGAVTGGVAPYSYQVDGGGYSGTLVYNNLAAGAHTVDVQDANGCIFSTPASISNSTGPSAVQITPTDATCGTANGSITIGTVTGGVAPYSYQLDGGGYTATLVYNNLAAGPHTVDVKDANGCIFSTPVTVNGTTGPTAIVVIPTDASYGTANGSLTLGAVTGGVAPYTYQVDGGGYSGTLVYNNLAAGAHTVDVKDANGCIYSTPASISNSTGPSAVQITPTDAACGTANGSITIGTVTGGVAPYSYQLDGGGYTATLVYNNLAAGPHTVDVQDNNGCILSTPVTINGSTGPTAIVVTSTDASCGTANGSLTLGAVTGGVAPYTYQVDGGGFSATLVYNNLAAGAHRVDVKDANGCIYSTPASISNSTGPSAVQITPTDATCGTANGSITIGTVTGGVAPYSYQLDGGGYTATLVYNNLAAGAHTVDVQDANGCILSTPVTI